MTAFLLLAIIGKALEIRKFIATSDLPVRDNKEHWVVKEQGTKIPHGEMRRRTGTQTHTAQAELSLSLLHLSQVSPPRALDSPGHAASTLQDSCTPIKHLL